MNINNELNLRRATSPTAISLNGIFTLYFICLINLHKCKFLRKYTKYIDFYGVLRVHIFHNWSKLVAFTIIFFNFFYKIRFPFITFFQEFTNIIMNNNYALLKFREKNYNKKIVTPRVVPEGSIDSYICMPK